MHRKKPCATAATAEKPYEIAALDARLRNMFKLQLGPLTLGKDVQPVMEMWHKLVMLRERYGRKQVAHTWLTLSRATAIVARKMSLDDVATTIACNTRLATPCPSGLRLPSGMLMALADRASAGGTLRAATDEQATRFYTAAGELLSVIGPCARATSSLHHIEKALDRYGTVV